MGLDSDLGVGPVKGNDAPADNAWMLLSLNLGSLVGSCGPPSRCWFASVFTPLKLESFHIPVFSLVIIMSTEKFGLELKKLVEKHFLKLFCCFIRIFVHVESSR